MKQFPLNVKRIDKKLSMPSYSTDGSIGFDLVAREKVEIKPFEVALVPLNVIIEIPRGYGLFLVPRSSTPLKKHLLIPNGVGVIDQDYCGDDDELKLQVLNFSKENVVVEKGERIAQAVIVKIEKSSFKEVVFMKKKSRGGFGSTG